jgi:6-pyruvoyltetrahydropterin/6-carboxytetrahydropterin synthase
MYTIAIEQHFDAAHFLRGYQGKCEALHGHRYKVVAKVNTSKLDGIGLAYDFGLLKQHLDEILSRFDHTCLNNVPPFDEINPSSENIAATVYQELKPQLAGKPVTITGIEVWETPQSWATYNPD